MGAKENYEKDYAKGREAARNEHEPDALDTIADFVIGGATAGMSEVLKKAPTEGQSEAFKHGYKDEKNR